MNSTAGQIGKWQEEYRGRCIALGEKTGLHEDEVVSRGCSPNYLSKFIAMEVGKLREKIGSNILAVTHLKHKYVTITVNQLIIMNNQTNHSIIDIETIKKTIPHRYPFLLVDRVLEVGPDFIRGIKNVTINEPFFQGHFPGESVMPGVLQIEAMAQLAAIFKMHSMTDDNLSVYFLTINKAKFRKKVTPGDALNLKVRIIRDTGSKMVFTGECSVDEKIASEAEMMAMIQKG